MEKQLEQVKEFHNKLNVVWNDEPTVVSDTTRSLRISLLREEVEEAIEAMEEGDIEHLAKELADVLYATYGTIGAYGLADKMPTVFSEVHASNMTKVPADDPNVKIMKGDDYRAADISSILRN